MVATTSRRAPAHTEAHLRGFIGLYEAALRSERKSARTIKIYIHVLGRFATWHEAAYGRDATLADYTRDQVRLFLADQDINMPAFDASTFSKNRQRLLDHDVARQFFEAVLAEARQRELLSDDHFTVDGTLLEAWASMKSVQPRDRDGDDGPPPTRGFKNPDVDYRGEKRSNQTHASRTDPQALLARKGPGKETRLCYAGHVLMENRHGLIVDIELTQATGTAEREAALVMLDRLERKRYRRLTLGADKGYDTREFVSELRQRKVTPHVAQNQSGRRSAIDGRTTSWGGYKVSQKLRKRVEEIFGWTKTVGGGRKLRYVGLKAN